MIPIVFSTDHGFVMPTGVALLSILKCSSDCELDVFILHNRSVTDEDKASLVRIVHEGNKRDNKISFISMNDIHSGAYEARGITCATYYRFRIPWMIPQYDKVVYCDGDVLFKKSIKALFEISLGDNYCTGVKRFLYDGYSYKKYAHKLNLAPYDYINCGVLLMNIKKMRDDSLVDEFERYVNKRYRYQDQDIINIVCKGKIGDLPFGFNVTPSMNMSEEETYIIHYAGLKPWKYFTYHWYEWWTVYKESPFFEKDLEKTIVERPLSIKQSLKVWIKWHYPNLYSKLREIIGEIPA